MGSRPECGGSPPGTRRFAAAARRFAAAMRRLSANLARTGNGPAAQGVIEGPVTQNRKDPAMPPTSPIRRAWIAVRAAHRRNNEEWIRRIERPQAQRPWDAP
jgi:hypothetical protein